MQITNHTQLLNYLITRYGLKSYLEIGVQRPENNFDRIQVRNKTGVDPNIPYNTESYTYNKDSNGTHLGYRSTVGVTSDYFFESNCNLCDPNDECKWRSLMPFDLIFIDGDHTADQVKRDFENSLHCLNDGGFIVLHDTCPDEEQYATNERNTRKWFGTVWQFAMDLGQYGVSFITLDIDCGITIVWKGKCRMDIWPPRHSQLEVISWSNYLKYKVQLLNIIPTSSLENNLPLIPNEQTAT